MSGQRRKLDVDTSPTKNNPIGFQDMKEVFEVFPCEVVGGKLPSFLEGNYFKQSGGAYNSGLDTAFLDGLAAITSFKLVGSQNKAYYSSSILDQRLSRDYLDSHGRVRNWAATASTGQDSRATLMDRARVWFRSLKDKIGLQDHNSYTSFNPNVVVWKLIDPSDGKSFPAAATENDGTVLRFEKDTLKTVGAVYTMKPADPGAMIVTTPAHYYEPRDTTSKRGGPYHVTLEMTMQGYFPPSFSFSFGIFAGESAPFRRVAERHITKFSYTERASQPVTGRPGYMHCYAQTSNYLVLFNSRMRLSYSKLLAQDFSEGFFGLFRPEEVPLELIVYRINHDPAKQELEYVGTFSDPQSAPMHVWHMSNAFEDVDGNIVIDCSGASKIGPEEQSFMSRIKLNVQKSSVQISRLGEGLYLEFPQANPLVNFAKYHFSYVLENVGKPESAVVKLNVQTGEVVARAYAGCEYLLAEPVFVPRTRKYGELTIDEEEDGAVLLAVTAPTDGGKSWLAVLNPKDLSEICRVVGPQVINAGLHSHFFPTEPLISRY